MSSVVTGMSGIAAAAERLGDLAGNLERRGFTPRLVTGGGYPYVNVANRLTTAMCETIYAAPAGTGRGGSGGHGLTGSHSFEDVEATASRVCGVLTTDD